MDTFMVIAKFRPDTDMGEVFAVIDDEVARVEVLRSDGRLGSVHVSLGRGTAFIETFAADEEDAHQTVLTLPMSKWWDLDIYPTATAEQAKAASPASASGGPA